MELKEKRMMTVLNSLSTKILLRIVPCLILRPYPHPADDDFANDVYNSGDNEEDESQLDQTREVQTSRSFCEFIGNHTRQSIARAENTGRNKI